MIKVSIKGIEKVKAYLKTVELGFKTIATRSVAEYLIGDESHGLKHYPPYKHVSYKQAYPENAAYGGFFSRAQQGYVMSQIAKGNIDPGISVSNRYYGDAWQITGEAPRYNIVNDVGYAPFLVGDNEQSKLFALKGWRKVSQTIADNYKGAIRHANAMINKWLREHK